MQRLRQSSPATGSHTGGPRRARPVRWSRDRPPHALDLLRRHRRPRPRWPDRPMISAGLSAAALTDHDSIEPACARLRRPASSGRRRGRARLRDLLPPRRRRAAARTCSATSSSRAPHPLQRRSPTLRHDRATRNLRLVELLAEIGYPIEPTRVEAIGGQAARRRRPAPLRRGPHRGLPRVASAQHQRGLQPPARARARAAYVPKARVSIAEATAIARDSVR